MGIHGGMKGSDLCGDSVNLPDASCLCQDINTALCCFICSDTKGRE